MKVFYINAGYDGCTYVRCIQPLIYNGWWGDKTSLRSPRISTKSMFQAAMNADVIVFQRPMQKEMLEAAKLLKEKGKKIVFDNDDTYKKDSGLPKNLGSILEQQIDEKIDEVNGNLYEFVKLADLVTTTTDFLADEYRPLNKNVVVLPNMVDPADWPKPKRNKGKKVRIGIVGSVAMNGDIEPAIETIKELGKREDVQLVLFALPPKRGDTVEVQKLYTAEYKFWEALNVTWQPFVPMADYFDTLNDLELDIMLIPRTDNYFNRCKSNIKFLEASMLEIPVIAQGFPDKKSPYQVNKGDQAHLLIAKDDKTWKEQVEILIGNKKLRREMGKNAKKYVLKNYNIQDKAHLWADEYRKLIDHENSK